MQVHRLEDLEVGGLEVGVKEIVAAAPDDVDVGDGLAAGALEAAVGVFELPAGVVGPAGDAVVGRGAPAVDSVRTTRCCESIAMVTPEGTSRSGGVRTIRRRWPPTDRTCSLDSPWKIVSPALPVSRFARADIASAPAGRICSGR